MSDKITPSVLVKKIRENMNNNGTLKALFASQFLSKFEMNELDGMVKSIEKQKMKRKEQEVDNLKKQLEEMGYEVVKK
jgi:uncharacterized protein YdcH (DUF465 family)